MADDNKRPAWLRIGSIILGAVLALFGVLLLLEFVAGSSTSTAGYTAFSNFFAVVTLVVLPLAVAAYLISSGIRKTVSKPSLLESILTAVAAIVLVFAAILTVYVAVRNLSDGLRTGLDVILIAVSLAGVAWAAFLSRRLMRKVS